jgi:hypothetical protein
MQPKRVSGVLRNALFCKVCSYPFDLTTAYNHLIVLYLLALVMQAAAAPLTDEMWRELGSIGRSRPPRGDESALPLRKSAIGRSVVQEYHQPDGSNKGMSP